MYFVQDVVGQIHPRCNSTTDRILPGKVLAQIIAWIESKGLEDANFSRCGFEIMRQQVVLDAAVKDNVNWEGRLQGAL